MSRKTLTAKAVVVAGAVAATTLFAGGTATAATPTVTKAGPVKAATTVAGTIAITGKDFDSTITGVVFQNASEYSCVASSVVLVSSTLLYATKPASGCVAGKQKVELHTAATPTDATTQIGSDFNPSAAANTVTFVAPIVASAVSVATGLTAGGTALTVTHTSVPSLTDKITATIGLFALPVKRLSATTFSTVTPPNFPGVQDIVLTAGGVAGGAYQGFTYKQGVKVTPAFAPKGTPGEVVLTGVGFKPKAASEAFVFFCGKYAGAVTDTTAKPYADKKLYVNAPAASAVEAAFTTAGDATVTNAAGGSCPVKVVVDPSGDSAISGNTITDGSAADDFSSVVTKDSVFTYAAY